MLVDVGDRLIPLLTPHVRSAAPCTVKPVLLRKGSEVKPEPFGLLEHRNVDRLGGRRLGEHEQNVAVVGRAPLRVGRDIRRVCIERNSRRSSERR